MATINGTSGNDTLTNLTSNDDFFGYAGNDVYEYDLGDGDDTITDSAGDDEVRFGAGISRYAVSLMQFGNDLIITAEGGGSITVKDHFVTSNEIETLNFDSDPSLNLVGANIFYLVTPGIYNSYDAVNGTAYDDIIFASLTYEQYSAILDPGNDQTWAYGGEGNNIIYCNYTWASAGDGDDVFYGNNWMAGGGGEDTFYIGEGSINGAAAYGGDGNDVFYNDNDGAFSLGQGGDDTFYANAKGTIFYGCEGNDTLYGGGGDDYLDGDLELINGSYVDWGGNDLIYGGDGNDSIMTGSGDDIVYGGNGNDSINALYSPAPGGVGPDLKASGNKELYGGDGDDFISSGSGDDIIDGGNGDDYIYDAGGGNNLISGGDGNDQVSVYTYGNNTVTGDNGDDRIGVLTGAGFTAHIYGDAGNDVLSFTGDGISAGTQYVYGGTGNDEYDTRYIPGNDFGVVTIFDQSGSADYLRIGNANSTDMVFAVSGTNLTIYHPYVVGSITITDMFVAAHRIENLEFLNVTGSLFETLTNSNNNYTATSSTSHLGLDQNFIEALGGNDTVNAGIGNDVVWGGNGDDTLNGNADNDILYGEAGNDTLRGGTGDDALDGGADFDTASYSTATAAVTVNLGTNTSSGADGSDTFVSIEGIIGSAYADSLTGDANNNTIAGGNGNDTIYGGNGGDLLYGNANNDTIYGEDGDDTLYGGAGNDTLNGGNGSDTASYTEATSAVTVSLAIATGQAVGGGQGTDTLSSMENLTGSSYNDTLTGNSSNNVIAGNNGNDTINGGDGSDNLYGDNGNDILNGGNGNDYLVGGANDDTLDGGSGTDMARFITATAGVTVNLVAGTVTGEGTDTLTSIEDVEGSIYNDTITGSAIGNLLKGGNGNDSLCGGDGLDVLYGETGADTFVFKGETAFNNVDVIADFASGTGGDYIDISDVLDDFGYDPMTHLLADWVSTSMSGSNTLLNVDRDGAGSTYSMQSIAQVNNMNLSLTDLTTDGNLIT